MPRSAVAARRRLDQPVTMRGVRAFVVAVLGSAAALSASSVEVSRTGAVQWVSGGVGTDEREEMILALPDHNLKVLTAAEGSGAFLAAVQVTLRATDGRTVLETSLEGPWLFARLPPGRYHLAATWGGRTQARSVTIPATGRREIFLYWADPGVETLPKGAAS